MKSKTRQIERFKDEGKLPVIELECLANLDIYESEEE